MSESGLSNAFSAAFAASADEPTNSEPDPPLANENHLKPPRAETRKPSTYSTWRSWQRDSEEKPTPATTPSTNWRDRSQPVDTSSSVFGWRSATRKEESNSVFQRQTSNTRLNSSNPCGDRRSNFVSRFPTSNSSALSALPGSARQAFGDSRNKFGSNSSIASDCSTSSVQPEDGRTRFSDSRRKFGSSRVTSAGRAVNGRGSDRGASFARGNADSFNNSWGVKSTRQGTDGSSKLSLEYLDSLLQKEIHEMVLEVTIDKSPFDAYLQKSPLQSDLLIFVLKVVAKICEADYEGSCQVLLDKVCKSPFWDNLSNYLGQMTLETNPQTLEKLPTRELCEFFSSLLDAWPTVAVEKNLRSLMMKTEIVVNNILPLDEDILRRLEMFIETFDKHKEMFKKKHVVDRQIRLKVEKKAYVAPPDDFRHLSLYPTREDLFRTQRGFVRPNIIKGAYENVEHYLDVQFRLLREDFISSLRSGVQKYLASQSEPGKKFKFDSIRVYPETRLVSWEQSRSSKQEVGIRLNFDPRKRFAHTRDWVQNKQFMHGSLLLLTANNFETFTCATVVERDVDSLKCGLVLAALVDVPPDFHRIFANPFTMVESEVFFEPSFLILQALKRLNDGSFPMIDYIVRGETVVELPMYPRGDTVGLYFNPFDSFSYQSRNNLWIDDSDSDEDDVDDAICGLWYDAGSYESEVDDSFKLDEYQMEAYEAGIGREFCVIQGPPGTGKTFLGLKIVQSILKKCRKDRGKLPILVVCLTNHALDQFLERILAFTDKIVRVGGQSRNENLASRNLRSLRSALFRYFRRQLRRKHRHFESMTSKITLEITVLGRRIENMQKMKKYIETPKGILSTILLKQVVGPNFLPVVENDETLLQWLLEDNECEALAEDHFVNLENLFDDAMNRNENLEPMKAEEGERNTSLNFELIYDVNFLRSYSITLDGLEEHLRSTKEQFDALIEEESLLLENRHYDWNAIYFEKNYLRNQIKYLTRRYNKLKANLETIVENPETKILFAMHQDPRILPSKFRWLIYWSWLSSVQNRLSLKITELETRHRAKVIQKEEYKMFEDLYIMRRAEIVGMTTTSAARLSKLLGILKPAIVIVEEAAEVLETHIVTSLTKSCRHLILIGDHKQLRPSVASFDLAKYYKMDVSLFERMINNGMHCPMLKVQHRMRPEISALITPLIYPDLKNHESVMSLEPIEGVKKNLFFLDHSMPETVTDDETSKENEHEAKFVVKLAKYFIQQGYEPEKITLLTFYAGQMLLIRSLMKYEDDLKYVKCVVVDKYQGEENYIIILSLVRSNEEGNIGFLSIENRICVALSRAKNGFFMIGNMECLAKSSVWQKLRTILKRDDAIGNRLPLHCDRHDKITLVLKAEDFRLVSNGGCGAICDLVMECGHKCKKMCHPTLGTHETNHCDEPCARTCPRNHVCKKLCNEDCGDCIEFVEKTLPCQHVAHVRCHVVEDSQLCTETVEDVLLSCDHLVKRKCHQKVEDVICTKPCRKLLNCGHICTRLCHLDDPNHVEFECKRQCGKYYVGCTKAHLCEKPCYENCGRCPHEENVKLPCGHELTLPCSTDLSMVKCQNSCPKTCPQCDLKCMKKCWENCHPCVNKVKKVIPTCGHEVNANCSDAPDQKLCLQDCKLMAPCGHKCQLKCGQVCDSRGCKEWVTSTARKPLCGHEKVYISCGEKNNVWQKTTENLLANCQEPCDATLECGDVCSGTCGQCLQGRLHQLCPKMCGRTFICGHKCKSPCQKLCPPCNEPCDFRCSHSKCREKCGIPCSTCKKPCEWKCKHSKCTRKCGDFCNRQPCHKPCELKLPCGHDCIGFCGEPCPPQCRFCNPEITERKFGFENAPDARFVLMVDCDHVIESGALDQHFSATSKDGEIALRGCPLCGTPITKTLRYMNFVKSTYRQIAEVKTKNYEDMRSVDLKKMFFEWRMLPSQCSKIQSLFDFSRFFTNNLPSRSEKHFIFSAETLSNYIYFFQVCQALISRVHEFETEPTKDEFFQNHVLPYLDGLIGRLQNVFNANRQRMEDMNWELKRYHLMVDFKCIDSDSLRRYEREDAEIPKICAEIKQILFGFAKFTLDDEDKIKKLFDNLKSRPKISSGFFCPKEKLAVKKEVPSIFDDLRAGSWFQCLDGHYYCADREKNSRNCPECVKKGSSAVSQSGKRRRRRGRR